MIVEASAPVRIDLAGGTLDLFPLYLFEDGGLTVNVAVEIRTSVRIEPIDQGLALHSVDLEQRLEAASARELPLGGPLDLLARAVRFASPAKGLRIVTQSDAPPGSGLGASSSLLICLLAALDRVTRRRRSRPALIELASRLETQSLRIPAGKQDYYAATYGGVNAIWFELERDRLEPLAANPQHRSLLEERLILSYTGQAHSSAVTNWSMLRAYIDGAPRTTAALRRIKHTALEVRDALRHHDFERLGPLLREEWEHRRQLADDVSTGTIDRLMAAAESAGALASKVCGAGGGGCMVTVVPKEAKAAVAAALSSHGALVLPVRIARRGLQVSTARRSRGGSDGAH